MGWVQETLATPGECYWMLRMNGNTFLALHDLLVDKYKLAPTVHMHTMEALAIFLYILGDGSSNQRAQNRFKHSGETISRKFEEVLFAVVELGRDIVRPKDPNFSNVHERIRKDRRMWPHFKDCIGAVDGTHILTVVPDEEKIRYIGRSKSTTQNVMAICDHDMRFIYASIGQPGSMHDTTVLFNALSTDIDIFPHPPQGNYHFQGYLQLQLELEFRARSL